MKYIEGDLLEAKAKALVNAVNTVGVMGKGIALQFKKAFPENYKIYKEACENADIDIGKLLVFEENEKLIINFPTKKHWRAKSKIKYIEEGLKDLLNVIEKHQIKSIAIPPLGCGNGGLDWEDVCPLIENHLKDLENIEILIYEPF